MSSLTEIMKTMYSSKDFSVKGYTMNLKDSFLVTYAASPYVVFIVEKSDLNGIGQSFSYALYSVKDTEEVEVSSPLYQEVTITFPSLVDLSNARDIVDFAQKRELSKRIDELTKLYSENYELPTKEKELYISYLADRKDITSTSLARIYKYFLERARM